jgi:hypothetical protein
MEASTRTRIYRFEKFFPTTPLPNSERGQKKINS